ncbi:DUF695 domain-containing protein [Rhodopirellula bahusiensis]|uniref:DUF695 domain-containing protein n=1 Tax=Rhodopirellula bahusiensis TaxID=2014065 RepID=A0A2G1W843_9BACT|nr:DUF695 domain-containing protein [Rhodopirellula bahusiensis]PHQ35202.1 hypothetical protein CEE69_12385 [Rhodopirellula bahusiensis]
MANDPEKHRWSLCELDYGGMPLFLRINESAREWIGHPDYGIKLGFAVQMLDSEGASIPDPTENESLADLEDRIVETVAEGADGIHVLTLTNASMKELVFYIKEGADIGAMHESLKNADATHEVQCQAVWDHDWAAFTEFLPEDDA